MSLFKPATVMVAHDNAVIEAGLRHILGASTEFEVLAPASSNAFPLRTGEPDMIVLDQDSGIDWAKSHHTKPVSPAKVLVVAMKGQETDVRLALESGVRGYVLMGCSADEIVTAARAVAAGRRHLCNTATLRMADSLAQPTLTPRESDVLALVFRGFNNKEVARSLVISVGTVKSHMRGLMAKLGARCRTEALWIASQRGLITRPEEGGVRESASPRPAATAKLAAPRAALGWPPSVPNRGIVQSATR